MELKFRAWDKNNMIMEYIHDLYWFEENGIRDTRGEGFHANYDIMTYSGMNDSKRNDEFPTGQEVYEKDVIMDLKGNTYKVVFFNGMFLAEAKSEVIGRKQLISVLSDGAYVVGNIYENEDMKR